VARHGPMAEPVIVHRKLAKITVEKLPQEISFKPIDSHAWSKDSDYARASAALEGLGFERQSVFLASPTEVGCRDLVRQERWTLCCDIGLLDGWNPYRNCRGIQRWLYRKLREHQRMRSTTLEELQLDSLWFDYTGQTAPTGVTTSPTRLCWPYATG